MNVKSLLPVAIIGGGYLLYKSINQAQSIARIHSQNAKVKSVKIGLLQVLVNMEVDIVNPSSVPIPFEYYTGNITHGATNLADFSFSGNGKNIIIAANGVTKLPFEVKIGNITGITTLIRLVRDLNQGKAVDKYLHIDSAMHVAGIDVPVKFAYDMQTFESISGWKWGKRFMHLVNPAYATHTFIRNRLRRTKRKNYRR